MEAAGLLLPPAACLLLVLHLMLETSVAYPPFLWQMAHPLPGLMLPIRLVRMECRRRIVPLAFREPQPWAFESRIVAASVAAALE